MLFIIIVAVGLCAVKPIKGSDKFHSTDSSHCFKRISTGERLIGYDVTRIIERDTVAECEEECNVYKCTHFSFGNATDGNGTCELTTDREISRTQDPNFDLYQRTEECAEGKPKGYEKACYRRIITGKRLHERFIRHSLPCNSLQACQHQCSIEKHFTCQGFNIRLDPAKVGRGICELSSVTVTHLNPARDFVFDPEFAYYERDHDNGLPNCGYFNPIPNALPAHNPDESAIGYRPSTNGGPYYGGDSYGPWSTGHGTVDHGPWGSHGYGSGFYESNNPSRGPAPSFYPDTTQQGPYSNRGYGYGYGYGYGNGPQGLPDTGGLPGGSASSYLPNIPTPPGPYGYGYGGGSQNNAFNGPGKGPSFAPKSPEGQGSYFGYNYGYGFGSRVDGFGGNSFGSPGVYQPRPFGQQGSSPGYGFSYGYGYGHGGTQSFGSYGGSNTPGRSGGPFQPGPYGGGRYSGRPEFQGSQSIWQQGPFSRYPVTGDRRGDNPNKSPTYIIIDAEAGEKHGNRRPDYRPYRPSTSYLPVRPPALPPPRPLPPPDTPQRPPSRPLPPPDFPQQAPSPQRPAPPLLPLPQPPRLLPPPYSIPPRDKFGISSSVAGREVCFRREHPGYKLNESTIKGMYETATVIECEAMCTNSPFKCTGYSFRYSSPGNGPNCLLTDYTSLNPETHLLPDRSCDVYLKMATCAEFDRKVDTECFLKVATNRKLDPGKIVQMLTVSGMSECELACLGSGIFTCRSYSFRHGPPIIGEPVENCFLSDWPISALTHFDFVPQGNHEVYERGSFGHGCELDAGSPHIGPRPPFTSYPNVPQVTHAKDPWGLGDTWRHFTVSGWPCRAGTECELNPQAGFWACEVEGGDRAQWDYCCRPKHSCGFSRGYQYPWCYVGEAGPDQWRPCSEFYYPAFGNRYQYKPVQSHNLHPDHSYGPPRDTRPWDFGSDEFGPPSYWPISYIYAEPPPNETYIWDPDEQFFYHHEEEHFELQPPEPYQENPAGESPKIRFKACGHKHPYPRAIIQKLDPKNVPKAGNPEEELKKKESPRAPKVEKEPSLGFSPENRDKKNSPEFPPPPMGSTLEKLAKSNGTNVSSSKTKEVIKEVEKIIMESSTGAEPEKNESLKKVETKHPGFFSLSLLEKPEFWN